jgi:hypothetical protein
MTERTSFPNGSTEYAPYIYTMSDPGNSDNSDALWDVLFSWPVIPASGAGGGQVGVEVDGDFLYTSVWGGLNTGPPWFAKYNKMTGALIEAFNIPGVTAVRDLAFDGTYFYGSPYSTTIYKMDFTTKTVVGTIPTSVTIRHIAYDPVNNGFWCGDWYTMYLVNATTGATMATGPAQTSAYGSAYDPDPAGPFLWVHAQNGSPQLDEVEQWKITGTTLTATGIIHNMSTVTGFPAGGGIAGGLCAADVGNKFALIGITQANVSGTANQVWAVELRAGGGPPPGGAGLLGYKIYRDGALQDTVMDPDTLFWYDFNVDPGVHEYAVSALYELTPYGYPGQYDDSMLEGPVEIDIMCGIELPFYEPWTNGSFTFQNWTLDPLTTTNWSVSSGVGNPAPSADFSWVPIQYDYSLSLETPVLNAGPFTCAMIWCDFDYKLIDRNSTGAEKLFVDVFYKGAWKKVAEFSNTASIDWTPMHVDISGAKGKAFKVRFRAAGANSADILHWYVDNVHIYAKCNPPIELDHSILDKEVTLTWSKPVCGAEGPPPTWITWDDGTNSGAIGLTAGGSWDVGAKWDPSMIATLAGGSVTKIKIYPYAAGTFILRVWNSDDGTNLIYEEPVSVTVGDWNEFSLTTPPAIDVTKALWVGYNLTHPAGTFPAGYDPGPCMAGYGLMGNLGSGWEDLNAYGFDYNWDIEVEIQGVKDSQKPVSLKQTPIVNVNPQLATNGKVNTHSSISTHSTTSAPMAVSALLGYNIYRSDDNKLTYNKLNTNLIPDTSYVNVVPDYGIYFYYVTSVFPSYGSLLCESDSSNVIMADVVIGIDELNGGRISIYPNPATENVFVKSDFTITNIEVLNYIGQTVYTRHNVSEKTVKVNVANFATGVYFVKVTTTDGIKTVKITVTK